MKRRELPARVVTRYLQAMAPKRPDVIYVTPQDFAKITGVPVDENPRVKQVRIKAKKPQEAIAIGDNLSHLEADLGLVNAYEYKKLVPLQLHMTQLEAPLPREKPSASTGGVRIEVDRDLSNKAHGNAIVAIFKSSLTLYRILDGEELTRIVKKGKITGGMFSTREERSHGASWGADRSEIISWGNALRGRRLGNELFLAEIDANGHRFFHINPGVTFDRQGPDKQLTGVDPQKFDVGLGCSVVDVSFRETTFYRVDPSGRAESISQAECHEYASARHEERNAIDIRPVVPDLYYTGSIHDVDVIVRFYGTDDLYSKTWRVETRDEQVVIIGAKTMAIAVKRAASILKTGRVPTTPLDLLSNARRKEWEERERFRELKRKQGW